MHKTDNVLNPLPKSGQVKAQQGLHEIWMAETRVQTERTLHHWCKRYDDKYPEATACLARDRDKLLALYDFPTARRMLPQTLVASLLGVNGAEVDPPIRSFA